MPIFPKRRATPLVFLVIDVPFVDAVSQETVAPQVMRSLVSALGIIAAVPITTAFAAVVARLALSGRFGTGGRSSGGGGFVVSSTGRD